MSTVKIGLTGQNATSLVAYAQALHDKVKGNPNFATPTPAMADLETAIGTLATTNAAVDANPGPVEHQARRVAMAAVEGLVRQLAGYVQAISAGDADIILSSGFAVRRKGSPIGELPRPTKLESLLTNTTGRGSLRWQAEYGADLYHVFMSESNEPFNWQLVGATTKSRFNADSLEPGKFYWFAVTAIGTAGETSLSEPCRVMAAA
ncbi:MAG: fibronectin type III domain-containing protein [Flavobacteriales bacterium]|nr:fibronectin type III domain-containing protein [Flavobacteriales bacterium]